MKVASTAPDKSAIANILMMAVLACLIIMTPAVHGEGVSKSIREYKDSIDHMVGVADRGMIVEIDKFIANLSDGAAQKLRVDLNLWKLDVLVRVKEIDTAGKLASEIFATYDRQSFESDKDFGDSMYQIVESLAKTSELDLSYQIIQHLRESVYEVPDAYLSFIIDRCLIEVAIETFDYRRALDVSRSILDNPEYMSIEEVRNLRAYILSEITFLYNRLGDGENALVFAEQSLTAYKSQDLSEKRRIKVKAQNSSNRGRAYLLLGNYYQVEKMGLEALEGGQQLKQNYLVALGYRLIGSASYHLGQYDKALSALEAGIAIAESDNIATMQSPLYQDYAMTLEKVGELEKALFWRKQHYDISMKVQDSLISTRAELNEVEFQALETHQKLLELAKENEAQRERAEVDRQTNRLLTITALSLLAGAVFLVFLLYYMRSNQKHVVRQAQIMESVNEQLKLAARRDPLTGMPNRMAVEAHLEEALKLAEENNEQLTIAHLDLDHFKEINDKYGHAAGDFLLNQIAMRMGEWNESDSFVARIGGDEFMVVLPSDLEPGCLEKNLVRLQDSIICPTNFEGITLSSCVSMGVSTFPIHAENRSELIVCADLALHEAKQSGGARLCMFESRLMDALNARKSLEHELVLALNQDDIFPFYQPQVNLETGQITGVEALVRWHHEKRGFIGPDQFLPVAESAGLMVRLGRHAMSQAIKEAANWHDANVPFGRLALNASASELQEEDFVDWLLDTASQHGLPTENLTVEVVETVVMEDASRWLGDKLARLRSAGIHIELDDFGTGYASLEQVKADEIDRLKIDRSFITDLNSEPGNAAIVGAIVEMTRKLDIGVIAEGAETQREMETLIKLGCCTVQGYGVAKPMSATVIREWFDIGVSFGESVEAGAGSRVKSSSDGLSV